MPGHLLQMCIRDSLGTAGMFDGVKAGDEVTVIYTGTLTNKTITAVGVK